MPEPKVVTEIVYQEKIVEKFVPVEMPPQIETKIVVREVEVPVEIKVPYPVERIVEQIVIKEVEVIKEVSVVVEKTVEIVVTKEVPVERIVYRELPMDLYIERSKYEALEREVKRLQLLVESKDHAPRTSTSGADFTSMETTYKAGSTYNTNAVHDTRTSYQEESSQLYNSQLYNSQPMVMRSEVSATSVREGTKMVGLGLSLARSSMGKTTYVTGTIPGYAAHRSGQLFVNDILEAVDEVDVMALDLEEIKRLTVGPENTVCALSIKRADKQLHVHLVRQAAVADGF